MLSQWWRHQMEIFSLLLAICAGNSPVPCEFPTQRPVTRSFDVFFDLCLNKRVRKQSWGWWFEMLSRPLWHHCNVYSSQSMNSTWIDWHATRWLSPHVLVSQVRPVICMNSLVEHHLGARQRSWDSINSLCQDGGGNTMITMTFSSNFKSSLF